MSCVTNKNKGQGNRLSHVKWECQNKIHVQVLFMKYYCTLLTINMSVQHRKLPTEHDDLDTHKSDCVADVKCKIH